MTVSGDEAGTGDATADESPPQSIAATLVRLKRAGGDETSLGDVLEALGQRTYGPLLFAVGVIALSPVGAIPGASVVCASVVILLALQMSLGAGAPWVPRSLRRLSVDGEQARRAVEAVEPYLTKLDRVLSARWQGLLERPAVHAVTLTMCALAVLMYPLALVPWGVMPVAFAITVLGLGLLGRDGVIVAAGLAVAAAAGGASYYLLA